ncbi:MAG: signal peptidase I [Bacteroidaceae bacterium]|nr:signal peptidase I [Bacteroidaceae bacterium]
MRSSSTQKKRIEQGIYWGNVFLWTLIALFLAWEGLRITTFASFTIPTGSMEPSILPGECIYVNKWTIGARIFHVFDAIDGKPVNIRRLPGMRRIEHDDIVVFNFPYQLYDRKQDSIRLNMKTYFAKRCIGLPGEDVEIRDGIYRVNGKNLPSRQPTVEKANPFYPDSLMQQDFHEKTVFRIDTAQHWTQKEFGPLHIPRKGEEIRLTNANVNIYRNLIAWEQAQQVRQSDGRIWLGDSAVASYRFLKDYYFMAGDNALHSVDSRYWGLVPEEFVVGVAAFVWKSVDPFTNRWRWERLFTPL